ncbi:MAG: response regulator [Deferribacterales bacterium]
MAYKILLADDSEDELFALKEILESEGYEVETAENGLFARDKAEETEYDLIVTDLVMPVSDGIHFLYSLNEDGSEVPVIVITGHDQIENMLSAFQMGAIDVLYKPYNVSQLLELIEKVLNKKI